MSSKASTVTSRKSHLIRKWGRISFGGLSFSQYSMVWRLIVPGTVFCSVVGDATLQGGGSWNEKESEFFSRKFPAHLIDPRIYIHIKEFLVSITSAKLWGHLWEGKRIAIYCDNEAVVKTMVN